MVKLMNKLIDSLRNANLRLTPQRQVICELLSMSEEHPTAQMIYEALKPKYHSLSLATVYNTLDHLVQVGAINALGEAGDDSVHYDADTSAHVNLACTRCKKVIDFPSDHIHEVEQEVLNNSGYRLLGARVMYYGLCPQCQQEEDAGKVAA